jgi:hypothetical protein
MAEQQRAFKGVWIPADIWLNENLSLQEKAVLAEIDSFCSRYEGCYASNDHFAKFIGVSTRRIRDILKSLEDKHLIEREVIYKKGTKEIEKRFLRLPYPLGRKLPHPTEENFPTPTEENCLENNTSINNTKNNNIYMQFAKKFNEKCVSLPKVRTKGSATRIKTVKARFKDLDEDWNKVDMFLNKVAYSDFLSGKTGWNHCSFDWIIKESNFTKIMEGNYDNKSSTYSNNNGFDDGVEVRWT